MRVIDIPANVSINLINKKQSKVVFKDIKQIPITQTICVKGVLGELHFPVHSGLKIEIKPYSDMINQIKIWKDEKIEEDYNKHKKRLLNSMWGTTNAVLKHMIEGVSEVFNVLF